MILKVEKSNNLRGEISMPASKTHSFRALVLASLAKGTSVIRNPKVGNDWDEAVRTMTMFGAKIEKESEKNIYQVKGVAGQPQTPENIINVGNSGTMLFFAAGVSAACPGWSVITGDESIRKLRKISKNLFVPYKELGINIISTKDDGMAPLLIKGGIKCGKAHMDGVGCQPVFSVLIASALSPKPVEIFTKNPGECAYIDLLLFWFDKVGLKYENVGNKHMHYIFPGNKSPKPFDVTIPFEWSAPPYPLLTALLTQNSEISIRGMDLSDPYGDREVIYLLRQMGANLNISPNILTARSSNLHAIEADMNNLPDQVPTIAVAACFARGKTVIKNAKTARWKECDRITAVCKELKKMGAKIYEREDGLVINQDDSWKLKGTSVSGCKDHRMVLSLAVAGLAADGAPTLISDAETVEKSFETFIPEMEIAGARLSLIN